jgi:hypothetical protein
MTIWSPEGSLGAYRNVRVGVDWVQTAITDDYIDLRVIAVFATQSNVGYSCSAQPCIDWWPNTGSRQYGDYSEAYVNHASNAWDNVCEASTVYRLPRQSADYQVTIGAIGGIWPNGWSGEVWSDQHALAHTVAAKPAAVSDFTVPASVAAGGQLSVSINRASGDYLHNVRLSFGSKAAGASDVATQTAFTVPLQWLEEIPNSTSGVASVTVDTYRNGVKTGTLTKYVTITCPAAVVPGAGSVSVSRIDNGVPSSWGCYVAGCSKAAITAAGASGAYGSTIVSTRLTAAGFTATAAGASASLTAGPFTQGTVTAMATVTDSRGRTSQASATLTVQGYTQPRFTGVLTQRANASGSPASDGTYALATVGYSFETVGGRNSLVRSLRYRESGASSWTDASQTFSSGTAFLFGGSFNAAKAYDVQYILQDALSTVTITDRVTPAAPILEVLKGGLGLAIGKEPDRTGLEVAWPALFSGASVAFKGASMLSQTYGPAFRNWMCTGHGDGSVTYHAYFRAQVLGACTDGTVLMAVQMDGRLDGTHLESSSYGSEYTYGIDLDAILEMCGKSYHSGAVARWRYTALAGGSAASQLDKQGFGTRVEVDASTHWMRLARVYTTAGATGSWGLGGLLKGALDVDFTVKAVSL